MAFLGSLSRFLEPGGSPHSLTRTFDPQANRHTEPPKLHFDKIRCLETVWFDSTGPAQS